jgi:hypothetical protein
MRTLSFFLLSILSFAGCKVSFHSPAEPIGFNIEPTTKSIVLVDAGFTNTPGLAIKKKRESVVKEVKNQYLVMLSSQLQKQSRLNIITDTTLDEQGKKKLVTKDPGVISHLNKTYSGALILILKDCYAGFRQGDVNKVPNADGKTSSKVAEYAVFFDTDWIIIQGNSTNEKTVTASKPHSTRSVQSGLLARGPGFSANKSDILEMAGDNAFRVAGLFKY